MVALSVQCVAVKFFYSGKMLNIAYKDNALGLGKAQVYSDFLV